MRAHRSFKPDYKKKVIEIYKKRREQGLQNYQIAERLGLQPQTLRTIVESTRGDAA